MSDILYKQNKNQTNVTRNEDNEKKVQKK